MKSGLKKWFLAAAFIAVFFVAHLIELAAWAASFPTLILRQANRPTLRLLDFLSR
jgi:hypothetical protein